MHIILYFASNAPTHSSAAKKCHRVCFEDDNWELSPSKYRFPKSEYQCWQTARISAYRTTNFVSGASDLEGPPPTSARKRSSQNIPGPLQLWRATSRAISAWSFSWNFLCAASRPVQPFSANDSDKKLHTARGETVFDRPKFKWSLQ